MEEWIRTPAIVVAAIAVIGLLWNAARWTSRIDADLISLKQFTQEIRDDIKQIFQRLPATPVTSNSPLQLTEFGEKIAEWLNAKKWASHQAESLLNKIEGMEPFRVDEFRRQYARTGLSDKWDKKVAMCAYEFGIDKSGIQSVLRVVLRDELLRRQSH